MPQAENLILRRGSKLTGPEKYIVRLNFNAIRPGKSLAGLDFKTIWEILKLFGSASKLSAVF